MKCEHCGHDVVARADKVSIRGMYDCHLFHRIEGRTVDEVIEAWLLHNANPRPAIVGGEKVEDLGPSVLCPAIVSAGGKEIRRVGKMVMENGDGLAAYRDALKADPDVPRLLSAG